MRDPRKTSGQWRVSVRSGVAWQSVRDARGLYSTGSLIEWGSITKGLVGTTAYLTLDVDRPVADFLPQVPDARSTTLTSSTTPRGDGASIWINGEVRAAGAVIANAAGVTAAVHALAKAPHAADAIATALIEREVRETCNG